MKVEMLNVGMLGTNCYFLINEDSKEMLVVDPGGEGARLVEKISNDGLTCCGILLTHGHCDHVDGVKELQDSLPGVKAYILDKDADMLLDYRKNMSRDVGLGHKEYHADVFLSDGDELTLAGLTFKVMSTPGHTPGGCCFYFKEENTVVSGDTLFRRSIGRSDFPGGSMEELEDSIRNKLYTLPDETVVLPGHMGATTIGEEKSLNMFVR